MTHEYAGSDVRRGDGETGEFRHAKSLQNLFRDGDTITHFKRYPSGQYALESKAKGKFITKVALPRTGRHRRPSATSADGADLAWDKTPCAEIYEYAQVNKAKGEGGQGQESKDDSYNDDSLSEPYFLFHENRTMNSDTEEEQMVSTDLDEESSSDESIKKDIRKGDSRDRRGTAGGEDAKDGKGGSFLKKKRSNVRRKTTSIRKQHLAKAAEDGTVPTDNKDKQRGGSDIVWDVTGEAHTSTLKDHDRMSGAEGKGGISTRRSGRLTSEEAQAIQALEREVSEEPGDEGPPAYEERPPTEGRTMEKKMTKGDKGGDDTVRREGQDKYVTDGKELGKPSIAERAFQAQEKSLKAKYGIENRKYVRLDQPFAATQPSGTKGCALMSPTAHVHQRTSTEMPTAKQTDMHKEKVTSFNEAMTSFRAEKTSPGMAEKVTSFSKTPTSSSAEKTSPGTAEQVTSFSKVLTPSEKALTPSGLTAEANMHIKKIPPTVLPKPSSARPTPSSAAYEELTLDTTKSSTPKAAAMTEPIADRTRPVRLSPVTSIPKADSTCTTKPTGKASATPSTTEEKGKPSNASTNTKDKNAHSKTKDKDATKDKYAHSKTKNKDATKDKDAKKKAEKAKEEEKKAKKLLKRQKKIDETEKKTHKETEESNGSQDKKGKFLLGDVKGLDSDEASVTGYDVNGDEGWSEMNVYM